MLYILYLVSCWFYLRIVAGGGIRDCVVPDSVNVFRFDKEYSLNQTLVSITNR